MYVVHIVYELNTKHNCLYCIKVVGITEGHFEQKRCQSYFHFRLSEMLKLCDFLKSILIIFPISVGAPIWKISKLVGFILKLPIFLNYSFDSKWLTMEVLHKMITNSAHVFGAYFLVTIDKSMKELQSKF